MSDEEFLERICSIYGVDRRFFEGKVKVKDAVQKKVEKEELIEVGKRLRKIRLERNLTLVELSKIINFSESQLSFIENGENRLTERRAKDIGEVLGVRAEWLLNGDERNKEFPVNDVIVEWLKTPLELRKELCYSSLTLILWRIFV